MSVSDLSNKMNIKEDIQRMIDHAIDSNGSNNEFDLSDHDIVEKSMQSSVTKFSNQQDQFR